MTDGFFWLRATQSFCSVGCALNRDERELHSVRAQSEMILRGVKDSADLYPERAGELWTKQTLAAEHVTAARYRLDNVVDTPTAEGTFLSDADPVGRKLCRQAYDRFCGILDDVVRGVQEFGLNPTLLDLAASVAQLGAEGREPTDEEGNFLAMSGAEVVRGLLDAGRTDEIMRCNAFCVMCDKVRIGTCKKSDAWQEGESLMTALTASAIAGETVCVPPVLTDVMARILHRLLRRL